MEVNADIMSLWEKKTEGTPFRSLFFAGRAEDAKTLSTPAIIPEQCSGILINDFRLQSLLFSTDLALIENNDADAVLAVYPFSPSPKLMRSLIAFAEKPVVCGIGGGLTQGKYALAMAQEAEQAGAVAVIVNQPFKNRDIEKIKRTISLPVISSVSVLNFDFRERVNAGVDIFHITGGSQTGNIIRHLSYAIPGFPVMATGGKTIESLAVSIDAGADAIVLTPPTTGDLFRNIMTRYRSGINYLKK